MSRLLDPYICPDCRAPLGAGNRCTHCGLVVAGPLAAQLWATMQQADQLIQQLRAADTGPPDPGESAGSQPPSVPAPPPAAPAAEAASGAPAPPHQPAPPPAPAPAAVAPELPADAAASSPASPPPPPPPPPPPAAPAGPTAPPQPVAYPHHPAPAAPSAAPPPPSRGLSASIPAILLTLGGLLLSVAAVVFMAVAWGSLSTEAKTAILAAVTVVVAGVAGFATYRGLRGSAETLWVIVAVFVTVDLIAALDTGLMGLNQLPDRAQASLVGAGLIIVAIASSALAASTRLKRLYLQPFVTGLGGLVIAAAAAWTHSADWPTLVALASFAAATVGLRYLLPDHAWATLGLAVLTWFALLVRGLNAIAEARAAEHWWQDLAGWPLLAAAAIATLLTVPAWTRHLPGLRWVGSSAALVALVLFVAGPLPANTGGVMAGLATTLVLAAVGTFTHPLWRYPAAALAAIGAWAWASLLLERLSDVLPGRFHNEFDFNFSYTSPAVAPWTAGLIAAVIVVAAAAAVAALGSLVRSQSTQPERPWLATPVVRYGIAPFIPAFWLTAGLGVAAAEMEHGSQLAAIAWGLGAFFALAAVLVAAHYWVSVLVGVAAAVAMATVSLEYLWLADGQTGMIVAIIAALIVTAAQLAPIPVLARLVAQLTAASLGTVAGLTWATTTQATIAFTALGAAIALVAILRHTRPWLQWVPLPYFGTVLGVRLIDDAVIPDAFTVIPGLALIAVGVWKLSTHRDASSWLFLPAGLTLTLLPSFVMALDNPVSARGAIVGVAAVATLALGLFQRWEAPTIFGAILIAVLAIRHLGPVAAALPRWVSLGSLGLALLIVGVTWELWIKQARAGVRYIRAMR